MEASGSSWKTLANTLSSMIVMLLGGLPTLPNVYNNTIFIKLFTLVYVRLIAPCGQLRLY